jgi:Putative bacterial sensory transduction regulator
MKRTQFKLETNTHLSTNMAVADEALPTATSSEPVMGEVFTIGVSPLQHSLPPSVLVAEAMAPQSRSHRVVFTNYLDQKEFVYTVLDEPGGDTGRCLIKAGIGGENGSYNLIVDIKEDPRNIVIVYVVSSLKFPRAHRLKLCEYITRANYSLVLGNFELDMDGRWLATWTIEFVSNARLSHDQKPRCCFYWHRRRGSLQVFSGGRSGRLVRGSHRSDHAGGMVHHGSVF